MDGEYDEDDIEGEYVSPGVDGVGLASTKVPNGGGAGPLALLSLSLQAAALS